MPKPLRAVLGSTLTVALVAGVVACGPSKNTNPSPQKFKPQPGHVIVNPNAAQSFMYLPFSAVQEPNGDLLIADAGNWDESGAKIVEMTPQGKPIWVYTGGLNFPHSAYPVGKNDILISDTNNDRVIMINRQGKTIWSTDNLGGGHGYLGQGKFSDGGRLEYPNDAVEEPNNDILISSRLNSTVWEINKSGHVDWKCNKFMFRQHRSRLDANGNLVVADSDNARVLIINHACNKILFDYGGTDAHGNYNIIWPRSFNPLPNGNYLIGDSVHNRVIEINPQKQIVQQWPNLPLPAYLWTMKNGNILLGDSNNHGAVELSPGGQLVRSYPTTDHTSLSSTLVNGGFEISQPHAWLKGDLLNETLPPGTQADMTYDTKVKHTGKSSGRISWLSSKPHLFLFYEQDIAVQAGRTYTFTGWLKTKNVLPCSGCDFGKGTQPGDSAVYVIQFIKPGPYTPPAAQIVGIPTTGTTPWTSHTQSVVIPPGVTGVRIQAVLYGKGTAWFDDVSFQ
jgi:hypothetical protein